MEIKEISEVKVDSEIYPIKLAEDQVFGYHEVADKIRKNAVTAASLEKQLDAYNDMWYDDSLYGCETTNSYNIRETANGAKVVNGSKAKLKEVEGNTVTGKNLCKPFSTPRELEGQNHNSARNWNGCKYLFPFAYSNYVQPFQTGDKIEIAGDKVTFTSSRQFYGVGFDVPCKPNTPYYVKFLDLVAEKIATNLVQVMYSYFDANGNLCRNSEGKEIGSAAAVSELAIPTSPANAAFLMVGVRPSQAMTSDQKISFSQIQVEEGTEATEYEPYFEGLKHITFEGIKSTGKNLCKPVSMRTRKSIGAREQGTSRPWDGNTLAFQTNAADYYTERMSENVNDANVLEALIVNADGTVTFKSASNTGFIIDSPCEGGKRYCFSVGESSTTAIRTAIAWYRKDGTFIYFDARTNQNYISVSVPDDARWLGCMVQCAPAMANQTITVGKLQLEEGVITPTEYEPYKESILNFSNIELPLGKTIDFDTKTITDYGVTIVCDTELISKANFARNDSGFILVNVLPKEEEPKRIGVSSIGYAVSGTGEPRVQVAYTGGQKNILFIGLPFWKGMDDSDNQDFKDWLQELADAGTPLTIRYLSTVATTESFDEENEYTVWKGGTEQILGNSLESYDTHPTITQDYLIIKQEENN